jgi:hypothetical protein
MTHAHPRYSGQILDLRSRRVLPPPLPRSAIPRGGFPMEFR